LKIGQRLSAGFLGAGIKPAEAGLPAGLLAVPSAQKPNGTHLQLHLELMRQALFPRRQKFISGIPARTAVHIGRFDSQR